MDRLSNSDTACMLASASLGVEVVVAALVLCSSNRVRAGVLQCGVMASQYDDQYSVVHAYVAANISTKGLSFASIERQ